MFKRSIEPLLIRFAAIYPIVIILGPRESGKTTLAKLLFKHLPYVSLENLDIRLRAREDPRGFLNQYLEGAIFDEIQNVPELLSYLQQIVDESDKKGRFILTGSQNFSLVAHISQSLAGRVGMTTLLPLSLEEINENIKTDRNIKAYIFKGGYPGLYKFNLSPVEFYPSYIQTYIERDVRQLKNIGNLGQFQNFIKLCAGRVGQVINFSSLAQGSGISHTTARQWLSLLEASYLIFFLQPFYTNFSKGLIKMPKLYFYDTGVVSSLLGLENEKQLETHYLKGALFENIIILEMLKKRLNSGLLSHLYFWRDHAGYEVDLIAEWGGQLKAIEIKSSSTFQLDYVKNLSYFSELTTLVKKYLIYTGDQKGMYKDINLVPYETVYSALDN